MKRYGIIRKELAERLHTGDCYSVFADKTLLITGEYQGYKDGRYNFKNQEGEFQVNIAKAKNPIVKQDDIIVWEWSDDLWLKYV